MRGEAGERACAGLLGPKRGHARVVYLRWLRWLEMFEMVEMVEMFEILEILEILEMVEMFEMFEMFEIPPQNSSSTYMISWISTLA